MSPRDGRKQEASQGGKPVRNVIGMIPATDDEFRALALAGRTGGLGEKAAQSVAETVRQAATEGATRALLAVHDTSEEPAESSMSLADAIDMVKGELAEAIRRCEAGPEIEFSLGSVELEFEVSFREDSTGKAELRVPWIGIGGSIGVGTQSGSSHRFRVTLNPSESLASRLFGSPKGD